MDIMTLLKDMWKLSKNDINALISESAVKDRAETIFDTFDEIYTFKFEDGMFETDTALDDDCPVASQGEVEQRMLKNIEEYDEQNNWKGQALKAFDIIWNRLSQFKCRDEQFRIFSEAENHSCYENFNTKVNTHNNRDSWFYAYNYPWHIIQWFQSQKNPQIPSYKLLDDKNNGDALNYKFLSKYLWMLSTLPLKDGKGSNCPVVPILSLRSFYNLLPLFEKIDPKFCEKFGVGEQHWEQSVEDFKKEWTSFSKKLFTSFEGSKKKIRDFAKFLFYVSLR